MKQLIGLAISQQYSLSNTLKVSKEDIAWLKWKKALEGHGVTVRKEEEEYKSTIYNLSGF